MAEWKIKRGDETFTAQDDEMLREWARGGRVQPSDYLFNPTLERWMYAREAEELAGVFARRTHTANASVGCSVAILGALVTLLFWPVGLVIIAAGLVIWIVGAKKADMAAPTTDGRPAFTDVPSTGRMVGLVIGALVVTMILIIAFVAIAGR